MASENELNELTLDGKRYISVKRAATLADYTTDYVGQLCRGGKLEAKRMGRNWYVLEESLIDHKQSQVLGKEKPQEIEPEIPEIPEIPETPEAPETGPEPSVFSLDRSSISEQSQRSQPSVFKRSFIVYEHDDRPLIPVLMQKETEEKPAPPTYAVPDGAAGRPPAIRDVVSIRDIVFQNAAAVPVTVHVSEPLPRKPITPQILGLLGGLFRPVRLAVAFAVLAGLIFSLNGSYAASLIIRGAGSMKASVLSTPIGEDVDTQIEPFRYAAREMNTIIDDTVYHLVYPDAEDAR